jgi:hypothetical protein
LPDPDFLKEKPHEDHQRILAAAVDRAVPLQTVFPCVPRSIGHRSRIRGVWKVRGAWRLVAGASDVPAVWLRRLLRQVKEQARPRAFPPNWPSPDPALQRAGYGLGVVLRGRGASRPDMTEVFVAGAYFGSPRTGVLTRWQARRNRHGCTSTECARLAPHLRRSSRTSEGPAAGLGSARPGWTRVGLTGAVGRSASSRCGSGGPPPRRSPPGGRTDEALRDA